MKRIETSLRQNVYGLLSGDGLIEITGSQKDINISAYRAIVTIAPGTVESQIVLNRNAVL